VHEDFHRRVVMGIELEAYTILVPEHRVSREMAFPRKGLSEKGERFGRDWSIGTEYNSRPFATIREGLFLVKAGLRKYSQHLYRSRARTRKRRQLLFVGGWRDRYAGAHIHLSIADRKLTKDEARRLAFHLHDLIPLLIAMGTNSPVWGDELTGVASNRILDASRIYFRPVRRGELSSRSMDEMLYSRGRKTKPPTIELRVLDSNIPEYVLAAAVIVKAAALRWLARKPAANRIPHADYLKSREHAARRGMAASLCWNGRWMPATRALDRCVWTLRDEIFAMDVPQEIWLALKLLKRGIGGSTLIERAARRCLDEHPQTWQKRFARRYVRAIDELLAGNSVLEFARRLDVELPDLDDTWLGRRRLKLS
jgi:hypothetical protein